MYKGNRNGIFELSDLNENFWRKVIMVNMSRTLMGILTSENKFYLLAYEYLPVDINAPEDISDFFLREETESVDARIFYKIEKKGWKYLENRNILIDERYCEHFELECQKEEKTGRFPCYAEVFSYKVLKNNTEIERYDEKELTIQLDEGLNERSETEKENIRKSIV